MTQASLAPVYRYYTADLLSNEIIAEIPFRGVSYERAVKGAGGFSGSIPVIAGTKTLDLYESTLPGKTALYIVRNGVCVWGGIIWTRSYNVVDRILQVSASEFTSYFHHRRIWKTWSHQFGATVTVKAGVAKAVFDHGSSTTLSPTSTLRLDFLEMSEYRYSGYYTVASTPAPTTDEFHIKDSESIATVISVEKTSSLVTIQTKGQHGYSSGDVITLDLGPAWAAYNGVHTITLIGGATTDRFTFSQAGDDLPLTDATGTATRPLPDGTYLGVTVSVRADTYDYIRSLVNSVFADFVGIDFPNVYIEPGISYAFNIIERELGDGLAYIQTDEPHNLAVGQAVQIQDLDSVFDGEHRVLETRAPDRFTYALGGALPSETVTIQSELISKVSALDGEVTVTTLDPHNILVGNSVAIGTGLEFGEIGIYLNGSFKVTAVPTSNTFKYLTGSQIDIPVTTLVDATAVMVSPASASNLIPNPSFGVDSAGWEPYGAVLPTIARSTASSYYGPSSLKVTCASASELQGVVLADRISVAVNTAYTASAWVKGTAGSKLMLLLRDFDGSGAVIGMSASETLTFTGQWQRIYSPREMSPNAVTADVVIQYQTPTALNFYVDAVMLDKSAELNDYFDGDSSDDIESLYSWTGAAHASTSIKKLVAQVVRRQILGNTVTLTTAEPSGCVVGQTVLVSGVTPAIAISEKSLEAVADVATITTLTPHELSVNDMASISGLRDTATLSQRSVSGSTVTFTTGMSHNLAVGDVTTISDLADVCTLTTTQLSGNLVTLTTSKAHNITTGTEISVSDIFTVCGTSSKYLYNNVAKITLTAAHNFAVNDTIAVAGLTDTATVISKSAENGVAILTVSSAHNYLEQEKIIVSGLGAPFDGEFSVLSFTDTRVFYEIEPQEAITVTGATGTVVNTNSVFNGEFTVSDVTSTTVSYQRTGNDVPPTAASGGVLTGSSPLNGTHICYDAPSATTVRFARTGNNTAATAVPAPTAEGQLPASVSRPSIHLGDRTITAVTRNTFKFSQGGIPNSVPFENVSGAATVDSIFNGLHLITAVTPTTFKYALSAANNVMEASANSLSYVRAPGVYNGTYTVTAVSTAGNTFSYIRAHVDMVNAPVFGYGSAIVRPSTVVSSFGPFPGNADIGIKFSTHKYSGINVAPTDFRGFELKNVGEALAAYSDSIHGFEYRIDCAYDRELREFTRTFVLIPIDFPNPPAPGEISPLSRFGADKLVFEYPGNVINVSLEESAENSSTRFFAVGETDLGPGAGPSFGVASSEELLRGATGRRWPLLDDDEQIKGIDDEAVLYAYAQRYLNEGRPPDAKLTVSVNGSLQPVIGTYAPGDWCSIIVDDEFLRQRLASDLEPRNTVIVRKIDSMKIVVPDGSTFPEKVDLTLVPEWEVDKRGQ